MRRASAVDRAAITAFLHGHVTGSMFPLSNLARYGMAGGHDRSVRFWLAEAGGYITDVLTVTEAGMVMPQCPTLPLSAIRAVVDGMSVIGVIGPAPQARAIIDALGLGRVATTLDVDEPQFALALDDLILPDGPGVLMPLNAAPRDVMRGWIADYESTTLGHDPAVARANAPGIYGARCAAGQHRVLMQGDVPLAMMGFNADLPQIVQVGGVYTPPDLRNKSYARRAVGLHLAEARAAGVGQATLFAAGPPAVCAYQALGFQRVGLWTLCLFARAVTVACP
jgi:GNAT superfamily N-acetyltransferase